ncbi:DUF2802 domain-containing protein [Parasalinivibrio latis]|uniref:DUF2802 domain-containing protein n=1 Tax=Parasalinivibrio latis TaxID=2952610 RepID=UPI0030DF5E42
MIALLIQWSPLVVSLLILAVCVLGLRKERKARESLENKCNAMETVLKNARVQNESLAKQLAELRAGSLGMGEKLAEMAGIIDEFDKKLNSVEMTDPDSRLYSRASRMVELGADLEELMEECELPKAEAELLMNLRKRSASRQR